MRATPSTSSSIREYELARVHVESPGGGVRVRLEVFSGGGFCASTAVWRIDRTVVSITEVGQA